MPDRGHDRVHLEHRAKAGAGADTTVELEQRATARVRDLLLVIQPGRFLVIDPLERHAGNVSTQNELGERASYVLRDEVQIHAEAVIRFFQIDAQHWACKISQSYARIQRRKTFI